MRRTIAIGAATIAVTALAGAAATAPASDIYIWGKVLGRVAGKNAATVQMRWAYKCLGDKLGAATYDWTLKVVRNAPLPRQTTTIGQGTSKFGTKTIVLGPGDYLPFSDPYRCEIDLGAGYDKPEIGAPFSVPNYCAWSVARVRGAVQLEHGTAVKAARSGSIAVPGDALVTLPRGAASVASLGKDGTAALAASSRVEVDTKQCATRGGWLLTLATGALTMGVPAGADAKRSYSVRTPNATATGSKGARWTVDFGKGMTRVRALAGRVRVVPKTGSPVSLKAGQSRTV